MPEECTVAYTLMTAWHQFAALEPAPEVRAIVREIDTLWGFMMGYLFNPEAAIEDVRAAVQITCAHLAEFAPPSAN